MSSRLATSVRSSRCHCGVAPRTREPARRVRCILPLLLTISAPPLGTPYALALRSSSRARTAANERVSRQPSRLAVRVERARRNTQAFVRLGLVVAGVRARPANPALAEHDRTGRHSCKYDTAMPPQREDPQRVPRGARHPCRLRRRRRRRKRSRRAPSALRARGLGAAALRELRPHDVRGPRGRDQRAQRRAERLVVAARGADIERASALPCASSATASSR